MFMKFNRQPIGLSYRGALHNTIMCGVCWGDEAIVLCVCVCVCVCVCGCVCVCVCVYDWTGYAPNGRKKSVTSQNICFSKITKILHDVVQRFPLRPKPLYIFWTGQLFWAECFTWHDPNNHKPSLVDFFNLVIVCFL